MIRDIQFQERFLSLKQILMKKATDLCKEDDGKKELLKFHGVDANIDDTKGKRFLFLVPKNLILERKNCWVV